MQACVRGRARCQQLPCAQHRGAAPADPAVVAEPGCSWGSQNQPRVTATRLYCIFVFSCKSSSTILYQELTFAACTSPCRSRSWSQARAGCVGTRSIGQGVRAGAGGTGLTPAALMEMSFKES